MSIERINNQVIDNPPTSRQQRIVLALNLKLSNTNRHSPSQWLSANVACIHIVKLCLKKRCKPSIMCLNRRVKLSLYDERGIKRALRFADRHQ